jgi:hypothetical protein
MSDDYRIEPLRLDDSGLADMAGLLRTVFPKARQLTPRYLHWLYRLNPDGTAVGCNAWHGSQLVGHLAAATLRARVDGAIRPALILLNSAVHPDHRGRRLQSRCSDAMFEEGAARGFDFVLSTGNRYSTKPLLTRFQMIGRLDVHLGLGRPRFRRSAPDPSFERYWSEEALRWRLANPEAAYAVTKKDGEVTIEAPTGIPGIGAVLYQGPGLVPPTASRSSPLKLWLGRDPAIDWARSTFLPIPVTLRPSPLNFFYRDLTGRLQRPDPGRFKICPLDLDIY